MITASRFYHPLRTMTRGAAKWIGPRHEAVQENRANSRSQNVDTPPINLMERESHLAILGRGVYSPTHADALCPNSLPGGGDGVVSCGMQPPVPEIESSGGRSEDGGGGIPEFDEFGEELSGPG